MAFGNATGQGFVNPSEVIAEKVIIVGDNGALYVYYPSQSLGDLQDSITDMVSEDAEGNALIPHITSYDPSAGQAASLNSGALQFYTGPVGGGGPWTEQAIIEFTQQSANGTGGLIFGFGSGDDNGFMCIYFPSGDATGATDLPNIIHLIEQFGNVWLTPGQYYVDGTVDIHEFPAALLKGLAGGKLVNIQIVTNNVPALWTAGAEQHVENITFEYATQQGAADTNGIGWIVGDDTYGSCFDSTFKNLTFIKSYTGWTSNPAITSVSGIFDCEVDNIRVLGWYNQAINVIGGNAVGAGNTACEFGDIFVHNNEAGPRASTAAAPVTFELFSDLVINSMSIQDAEVDASDCLQIVNCGSVTINALHFEALDLGGDDYGFVYCSHDTTLIINSMTIQFCSSNPTTFNSVFRLFGNSGETPSIICNGPNLLNNTIDKLLYWVDFSATGPGGTSTALSETCIINCIAKNTSTTGQFTGFITGGSLVIVPAIWNYVGAAGQPAFAANWGNFGSGNADLAFVMTAPNEVWINGVVTPSAGAGTTLFTLPAAFSPANINIISGTDVTTSAACTWAVNTAGAVVLRGTLTTNNEYVINGRIALTL